jgi:hypothetical protein
MEPAPTVHVPPSDASADVAVGVGRGVGLTVGFGVGRGVGFGVGRAVGFVVACAVGFVVGFAVPTPVGRAVDPAVVGAGKLACGGSTEDPADGAPNGAIDESAGAEPVGTTAA